MAGRLVLLGLDSDPLSAAIRAKRLPDRDTGFG